MTSKNLSKNKRGESFEFGLTIVLLSIIITVFAFISENNNITGFAAISDATNHIEPQLPEHKDVDSLASLAPGNYFIDGDGIVYWIDDEAWPAIAKVKLLDGAQKNRHIYIDARGNIGYVLS